MHNTGKIREMSYALHLTSYHIISPLPKFKLCNTSMQVERLVLSSFPVSFGFTHAQNELWVASDSLPYPLSFTQV